MSDLFIVSGEVSGDLHGEHLLKSLYALNPNLKISGVGGPKMRAVGMESFLEMEAFEVMGFFDILSSLPRLYKLFKKMKKHLLKKPPKVIVFIDYPGFNLRMARALVRKKCLAKKIHYSCPTVWAWGKRRIPLMEKSLDKLLALLPFEPALFSKTTLDVDYVGHPLMQRINDHHYDQNWRALYAIPKQSALVSLFPGSRKKEILRNFPMQVQALQTLLKERKEFTLAVSCSDKKFLPFLKNTSSSQVKIIDAKHRYEQMRDSHLAVATSGTITLELALHAVPTVVTYAIAPLDLFIARHLLRIHLPHYALPNIIRQKEIFPELFGPHFTKSALEESLCAFLVSPAKRNICKEECRTLKQLLDPRDVRRQAAHLILDMVQENGELFPN